MALNKTASALIDSAFNCPRLAIHELNSISRLERAMVGWWLIGPFLFLVERSPADIWVVTVDLAFLIRCTVTRDWSWLRPFWSRAIIAFWGTTFISAVFSELPQTAAMESLIWVRFPLLVFAAAFWLTNYRHVLRLLLLFTGLGLVLMFVILTAEIALNYDYWAGDFGMSARLSWPYGDPVSGNYIAKFGLIVAVWAVAGVSGSDRVKQIVGCLISLLMIVFVTLTGERINTLLVFCTASLTLLWLNPKRIWFVVPALLGISSALIAAIFSNNKMFEKFTSSLWQGLFNVNESGYLQLWGTGLELFKSSPITGLGTGMFRFLCDENNLRDLSFARCDNHPHQYYIQVLAETGLIGFLAFIVMVCAIIHAVWAYGRKTSCLFSKVCFIVPLALFFPLQSTADVFGQWVNSMLWYSVALSFAFSTAKKA